MNKVWRAATHFAQKGWPVVPWNDGPTATPSADADRVAGWAKSHRNLEVAVDLTGAGLVVLCAERSADLGSLFGYVNWWPDQGTLTVVDGDGRWLWFLVRPPRLLPPEDVVSLPSGFTIVDDFVFVPGSTVGGRVEHDADLEAAVCPPWLIAKITVPEELVDTPMF